MKRRKVTTTVTFETERFLILGGSSGAQCDVCGGNAALVGLNKAARHAGISEPAVRRDVETHGVHFIETPDGHLLICLDSLAQWTQHLRKERKTK
jgi:hypothetical protein